MTDLHTHILPGMDDGPKDIGTSLKMLQMESAQGVNTVALTPHFYRSREHVPDFLARRERAMEQLSAAVDTQAHPELLLAAEVAYAPGMADWPELDQLCYAGTNTLLIEPPMSPWNEEMFRQLYAIEGRRGITPMIAHIDRYLGSQSKGKIAQLLEIGFPIQVSAEVLVKWGGRKRGLKLLTDYNAVLISDCHNASTRPPNLGDAVRVLEKKLGREARRVIRNSDEALWG